MSKIRLHGSSSGYTEIAPVAASGNNTLTLPNDGTIISKDSNGAVGVTSVHTTNITATGIATITTAKVGAAVTISESGIEASGIGITCANINGTQIGGRRNIIINGAMNVAQRGTSSTTSGYASVDRFSTQYLGLDEALTQAQADVASGTTPYTLGFRKALKITNGNQTTSPASNDYIRVFQAIEAQNIASSGWNYTSSSSNITLSFWIKSSVAQNFYGYLLTQDGTAQMYPYETGSLTADTWTKITKTISGNSNLQFDNDSNAGLYFFIWPFAGTDYTSNSATNNAWATYSGSARMKDATSTWFTTNDATLEITGVQLEVGPQATAFEHRSFGEELQLCGRYYQRISGGNGTAIAMAHNYNTSLVDWVAQYPMGPMRTVPSFDQVTGSNYYLYQGGGQSANYLDGSFVLEQGTTTQANVYFDPDNSLTAGGVGYIITNNNDAYLAFTAEL